MLAEGQSYLAITREMAGQLDYRESKYWTQAYGVLGSALLDLMAKGDILPEYFQKDFSIELHFELSEHIALWLSHNLLAAPESQSLRKALDQSPDHGEDHFRRLGKWYKKGQAVDKMIRADVGYLYFSPSAFIAKHTHDLVETYSGQKEKHDGTDALLALGHTLQSIDLVDAALSDFSNGKFSEFPRDDWNKVAWGAAFICQHHSRPELMPSTEDLLEMQSRKEGQLGYVGIVDPLRLLKDAEYMLEEANGKRLERGEKAFTSIEEFFPPFRLIRDFIQQIRDGVVEIPQFDEKEIEGLKKQTRLFAAADKLDSTYPAELSAVRTFQTRPDRPFFVRLEGDMTLEAELRERIRLGSGHESPCDFDRLIFEMTRVKTFTEIGIVVQRWYANGLRSKGKFLKEAISRLIDGDGDVFLQTYENLEGDMAGALLKKAGYASDYSGYVVRLKDKAMRRKEVEEALAVEGFDPRIFEAVLYRIRSERGVIGNIIDKKIQQIFALGLTSDEKHRIRTLLSMARVMQDEGLSWIPGPATENPIPYDGYIHVRLTRSSSDVK